MASQAVDIRSNVATYLGDRCPDRRYASFDYCFNYFRSHHESDRLEDLARGDALQVSCLHLGFYLASWGMLRGSTELLKRSVRSLTPAIEALVAAPPPLWTIDIDRYTEETVDEIIKYANTLRVALHRRASDILVTKTMLGVMGCVPAFDANFKSGFGVSSFNRKSLLAVERFYRANAPIIDQLRCTTLDFQTGKPTSRLYTRAKVIDMIFFVEGAG